MTYQLVPTPITLKAAHLPIPDDELLIKIQAAPDTPTKDSAGGQVGDIHLENEMGRSVVIVSLGKSSKVIRDSYRQAGGKLADWLVKRHVPLAGLEADRLDTGDLAAFCEGLFLGSFRFNRYKYIENKETVCIVTLRSESETYANLAHRAACLIESVNMARDWQHEPANKINPISLSERAQALGKSLGLKCTVIDDAELTKMGAGAITAVGKGSKTPARMIIMEYPGMGKGVGTKPVALVGKAITFDTGGYSLKDTTNIQKMKFDKCGGIDVLAITKAAVELQIETPLVTVVCAAENMISGGAYRPDDILTSLSGKTIEIITTDAEGRLVLADGLTYVQRHYNPRAVIDIATLTGGVVTALGRVRAGIFSNDDSLCQMLTSAGDATHERLWRLPLDEDYFLSIKGDDADLKNSGGKEGHPVMGGIFLKQFIENDIPWAHLDIAGVADSPKDLPYIQKGATGFGIRLMIEYLSQLSK